MVEHVDDFFGIVLKEVWNTVKRLLVHYLELDKVIELSNEKETFLGKEIRKENEFIAISQEAKITELEPFQSDEELKKIEVENPLRTLSPGEITRLKSIRGGVGYVVLDRPDAIF